MSAVSTAPAPAPAPAPDSWDHPSISLHAPSLPLPNHAPQPSARRPSAPTPHIVPDSWDISDDDEPSEPDNHKIWADANAKPPMPALLIAPSAAAPPPAALHAPMRILKRPPPAPSPAAPPAGAAGESMKDREARYHAARERIFGEQPLEAHAGKAAAGGVLRNPRGPQVGDAEEEGGVSRGFGARRKKAKSPAGPVSPPA